MKYIVTFAAIAALFVAEPSLAGSMSDSAMSADAVAVEATASSDPTVDIIMLTIFNVLLLMMAGGAF